MDHDYKLLVVSNEQSFITDSIIAAIDESGVNCICVDSEIKEIEVKKDEADMVFLYVNEALADNTQALVFIKDVCVDDVKTLFLAGYSEDLEKAYRVIPRDIVKEAFIRPFENKNIVKVISNEAEEARKRRGAKRILVVDDDITFLKMVKKWLMEKYQVTIVKSGMQAIKYITGHRPDLILMDYDMPITDGTKVLEMLRSESDSAEIPVIFLTGKADKETVMKVMSLKPQGYLLKSMRQMDIVSAIDHYFETEKWQNIIPF
ncbi:MAG: response regulator [Eubacterium sp.]|nr:response regulator [Eubacterium sp.]MBR0119188.1 response regulator [Eubacterium sp.]